MIRVLSTPFLALSAVLLTACSSGPTHQEAQLAEVQNLTRAGQYEPAALLAVDLLEGLSDDSPLRPAAEQARRDVSLASGMDVVRTLILADDEEEALELLDELDRRFPDSTVVAAWQDRARSKLAIRWFEVASQAQASSFFDAARVAYAKAVEYDPSYALADAALTGLTTLEEYRASLAEDYYYDGVRTLTDLKLSEAQGAFTKSHKYDDDNERTQQRITEVEREKAKARVKYAEEELIASRRYAAGATEYAAAARLDPESEEIAARLEVLRVEARVTAMISEADSSRLRGDFEKAEAILREASEKTVMQDDLVDARLSTIDDSRVGARYQAALNLEYDFRFPEAIEGYAAILETRDFYEDVLARLDDLRGHVTEAERLYAEAEQASDDAAKLELYRQIEIFWPDYLDVPARIQALAGGS